MLGYNERKKKSVTYAPMKDFGKGENMSGFFSNSGSRRRYPNPHQGGAHYRRKGFFGILGSLSGSGRSSSARYGQGYPQGGYMQGNNSQGGYQPSGDSQSARPQTYQGTSPAGGMICPKCGASVPAGSKFCLSCGEKLAAGPVFCTGCGRELPPGAKFCMECGTPVQR